MQSVGDAYKVRPTSAAGRPVASLSLDLDNKWAYLKTRGDVGWKSLPSYLEFLVPRMLDVLEQHRLTITFFVVGQDAALDRHRDVLASIADAGHEIGNHSFHHDPWLHTYSSGRITREIALAEEHLERVTGQRPIGFRGPGYSVCEKTLRVLADRGYRYDASTFPTFIGPLARAYFLFASRLSPAEKAKRTSIFGGMGEALRSLDPSYWDLPGGRRLLEIPVSAMPLFRVPFHFNYVVYLSAFSRHLAMAYFRSALALCRATGTAPSLLLHPLDFLGCDEETDLSWCPGMNLTARYKLGVLHDALTAMAEQFSIRSMVQHAESVSRTPGRLRVFKPVFSHQEG